MALHWSINSECQLISAKGEGPLTFNDISAFHAAIAGAKVLGYRRFVDLSGSEPAMTAEEVMVLAAQTRKLHQDDGHMGPLAIVASPTMFEAAKPLFGVLACADRPMRVFGSSEQARRWIESFAPPQAQHCAPE